MIHLISVTVSPQILHYDSLYQCLEKNRVIICSQAKKKDAGMKADLERLQWTETDATERVKQKERSKNPGRSMAALHIFHTQCSAPTQELIPPLFYFFPFTFASFTPRPCVTHSLTLELNCSPPNLYSSLFFHYTSLFPLCSASACVSLLLFLSSFQADMSNVLRVR